jgi:hypothetical protein
LQEQIPCFGDGVENIAFRVDPAWYRYEFLHRSTGGFEQCIRDSLAEEKDGSEEGEIADGPPSPDQFKELEMLRTIAWSFSPSARWIKNVWLVDTEIRRRKTWKRHHKGKKRDKGLGSRKVFYGNGFRFVEVRQGDPGWDFTASHRESQLKGYKGKRPNGEGVGEKLKDRNAFHLVQGMKYFAWRDYRDSRAWQVHQNWNDNIAYPKVGVLAMEKWP